MKKTSSWLWGGILIALGVILGVNALGLARIDIFFPGWWTLFIIVPSLVGLFTDEHKGGAMVGLIIGVCFLLSSLGVVPFSILWKLLLPALLVLIGFMVIARGNSNGEVAERIAKVKKKQYDESGKHIVEAEVVFGDDRSTEGEQHGEDAGDGEQHSEDIADGEQRGEGVGDGEQRGEGGHKENNGEGAHTHEKKSEGKTSDNDEYWSTFSDQQVNYNGKVFTGCKVDAVFGGADVDLRGAKIRNESILKASSVFGGIIVYVPENVKVEVASTSIFGGVSDKRKNRADKMDKTLYIEATCVFGGVEIR